MKKGDLVTTIALLFALCVFVGLKFAFATRQYSTLEVMSDGKVVFSKPLTEASGVFEVTSKEGKLKVKVQDGKVWVSESSCKDKICINSGSISRTGESIVCLPNRITISIKGDSGEFDTTTY